MKNSVATIVVTYNRLTLLKECINSLRQQTFSKNQIVIINNGSTDGTLDWLNKQNDIVVITQENLGGAGGFHTGIKWACENGYEYSWIMDDDVIASNTALECLMSKINYSNGFLCSRVLDTNNELCNVPMISRRKSSKTGELTWGNQLHHNMVKVDIASFVSLLIPTRLVYELGLPYKEYFIWGDDTEYTQRISDNYESYMAIDSIVLHKRVINGVLSIFTEKNKNRIHNYFYSYRNRIHNQKGIINKFKIATLAIVDILKLLLRFEFRKIAVIISALFSAIIFSPNIEYPANK